MTNQQRQGDVLIVKTDDAVPPQAKNAKPMKGKGHVLMWGEVTHHSHRFAEARKVRVRDVGAQRFIEVLEKTALTHEEHGAILLDKGTYRQAFQVEDYGQEVRRVAD